MGLVRAYNDLPALVRAAAKNGELAKTALGVVASIGGGLLQFLASFIIAGIIMAFGAAGERGSRSIFGRIAGVEQGEEFVKLSTATIRAVAQGVIGVAFIQAIIAGICLLVAGFRGRACWRPLSWSWESPRFLR
jgi:predicted PurR-regulated permease PerM